MKKNVMPLVAFVVGASSLALLGRAQSDQTQPAFEVTSVKPNTSHSTGIGGPGDRLVNGEFRQTNIPLRALIRLAFQQMQSDEIVGGPSWLDTDRGDIVGKTELATAPAPPMLRTLLADRFKLVVRHETKELPMYSLVVVKQGTAGPLMRASTERTLYRQAVGTFIGKAVPLKTLVDVLAFAVQRPVVDRTQLTGKYDVDLHWAPFGTDASGSGSPAPDAPSIFTALQEQLGLKLEPTEGLVDVLVIDHVERPTRTE